MIYSKLIFYL
jgi:regulator of protease activity HflC (stomatin/prohibitin superfamily)